ncbi:hypothetical protein BXP70_23205 [Hymenobacter crusticola]|uniref:Uncharacterized protein n=2 Tax=Hymenobacter crusticola TaxID=1770526 RepID=A0A243W8U9_9BACT|nr:hypothetical protein BXP70_23205 [Hymenobacter crusticola]
MSVALKEAPLPPIPTYAKSGDTRPKITVTVWVEDALPSDAEGGYEVISELLVDGRIVADTSFKVVPGQNTPLYAITQTEVAY